MVANMVFVFPWLCVEDKTEAIIIQPKVTTTNKTFAEALGGKSIISNVQLPKPTIKGDALSIKITQAVYEKGIEDYKCRLHDRLIMSKGDRPYTSKDLYSKLSKIWKVVGPWTKDFTPSKQHQMHEC